MTCTQCGEEREDGTGYCSGCGTFIGQTSEAPSTIASCPSCGAVNERSDCFCVQCGFRMDRPNECPGCSNPVGRKDQICTRCGRFLRPVKKYKVTHRPLAALVLGLVPGLLSLWGIGHIFAGSSKRGFVFLAIGLMMLLVAPVSLLVLISVDPDLLGLAVIGVLVWVALWLYQSVDAYWEAGGD